MFRAANLLLIAAFLQTETAQPRFEAASIRVSQGDELEAPSGCPTDPGLIRCTNVTLKRAITGAYDVVPDRVLGGPDWIDSDRFQITAKVAQPVREEELDKMLQTLLAERFHLKLHREMRTLPGFVLEIGKNGPKLQPAAGASRSLYNAHGHMEAASVTMSMLAQTLSREFGLPVVDGTGLTGAFNFRLVWNPDSPLTLELGTGAASDAGVELFNSIQQQLGLTLKSRRMRVEVLVVDHAEKPIGDW
jgi:uncharacterized protein (TIGR03435 family)